MKKNIFKKAFTLAEIMIVLSIVGILVAVLLPSAFHSTPDEGLMKFKKSNSTFYNIVNELVSTGRYFKQGDLRFRPSGEDNTPEALRLEGKNANFVGYTCKMFADILNAKKDECDSTPTTGQASVIYRPYSVTCTGSACSGTAAGDCCNLVKTKEKLDSLCEGITTPKGVTTADDVIWYEVKSSKTEDFENPECDASTQIDCNNKYKVFCIRVVSRSGNKTYGYGIRSDGKVIPGKHADDDVDADITEKD